MKKLLMGNEAIALGALRAGVQVAAGYPGTPSTEILETLVKYHREWKLARDGTRGSGPEYTGPDCASLIHAEWSVNEKSALEVAAGAAWAGARALVTMKQVGLNVASDPLMSLNYLGVQGALVVAVADDPGPISSQTEQDTRRFGLYAKIAVFDPASPEEAYTMIGDAFAFSEKYGRPVILRPTTRVCHSYAGVSLLPDPRRNPEKQNPGFEKQGGRWVIFPSLSYRSHLKIEEDLRAMAEEFSGYGANRITETAPTRDEDPEQAGPPPRRGIALGGVSRMYVKELLSSLAPVCRVLEIAGYPFPDRLAAAFLADLDEVLVLEELDPVIEDALTGLAGREHLRLRIRGKRSGDSPEAGEQTLADLEKRLRAFLDMDAGMPAAVPGPSGAEAPPLPPRPPVLCAGCPHRASFFAVKEAVRRFEGGRRKAVYSGDIGCYTLGNARPLDMVDTCLCMGAGITAAQGINRVEAALGRDTLNFAFIGDSTFFHTGIPGIVNAVYNDASIIVIILDNYTTAMTGSQSHPGVGKSIYGSPAAKISIPGVLKALGVAETLCLNPFDQPAAQEGLLSLLGKRGVRAAVFEGPCIMVSRRGTSCAVDPGRCTGCGACVKKLGCPALSLQPVPSLQPALEPGRLVCRLDPALCTGCGVCRHLCAFDAITGGEA
ncbi:MAG: indolepyruvate ferredoxin oxidoreductase subunit alpha [Treponema sp.]|jgi:indolepyruvate ferredoxin oxidoreductase alpha subunit|nr:indolepyruvate ferredoxin oxidoreductase subunit alpha [Treponema sp.]